MIRTLAFNLIALLLGAIPFFFLNGEDVLNWAILLLVIAGFVLVIQLAIGIVYSITTGKKETGQGLLIGVGISLLMGLCVCGAAGLL